MAASKKALNEQVHCRTGSLEMERVAVQLERIVHCRTGSLENADADA